MLLESLINISKKKPKSVAFFTDKEIITYKESINFIKKTSLFLQSIGCKKNSRVILSAKNSIQWIFFYFAIQYLGAIPVIIGKFFPKNNLKEVITKYKIKFIITDKKIKKKPIKNITNIITSNIKKKNFFNNFNLKIEKIYKPKISSISEILFTSGSTNNPKGVILTKRNSFYIAKQISENVKTNSKYKEILFLPLSHSFGLGRLKSMVLTGNSLIILEDTSNYAKFLLYIKQYKANGFAIVPSSLEIIKKIDSKYISKFKSFLKFIELGSERINSFTINWLLQMLPKTKIYHHYGMTEASRTLFIRYNKRNILKKNFIGKESAYSKINILDKNLKECKTNNIGQITIKGPCVMKDYLNKKEKIFYKNSFLTGDYGYKDNQGNVFFVGRKDSLIKINGINVSLIEIEDCINAYPSIKECLCVIKENKSGYEKFIHANIVCSKKISILNLIRFMESKIETYKIPKNFEIVKKIPKSDTNKLIRRFN